MPSIEENLEIIAKNSGRTADALEALAKLMANPITTSVTTVVAADTQAAETVKAAGAKAASGKEKDKSTDPKKPAEQPKPEPETEVDPLGDETSAVEQPTEDEVRAALKSYRDIEGSGAMLDILKQHGATGLKDLKPENYAAVIAATK